MPARRLFVGDLHGCREELDALLEAFAFRPGKDRLFSVGDVVGKGPDVRGVLQKLWDLGAQAVRGNHDQALLDAAGLPEDRRKPKHWEYLAPLEGDSQRWIAYVASWPMYFELTDLILVHGGLEPGKASLDAMSPRILMNIRTWDGKGLDLNRPGDPPWFECVDSPKPVVFGHWAQRGRIDLLRFKGLDTGCVYGGKLTGWCPEEDRFHQVPARRAYAEIHKH